MDANCICDAQIPILLTTIFNPVLYYISRIGKHALDANIVGMGFQRTLKIFRISHIAHATSMQELGARGPYEHPVQNQTV